jgi:hypothetical protein
MREIQRPGPGAGERQAIRRERKSMKAIRFALKGTSPLLIQAATLADPLHELTKALKAVSGKKTKTDDDIRRMGELEFRASLYFDETLGPVIPAQNFERMLRDAGTMTKRGRDVQRALMVVDDLVPIEYDGPRDLPRLEKDKRFHSRMSVKVKQARTVRERPIFHDWGCKVTVSYDEKLFNQDEIIEIMAKSGRYIGIGTFRPRYGQFEAEVIK